MQIVELGEDGTKAENNGLKAFFLNTVNIAGIVRKSTSEKVLGNNMMIWRPPWSYASDHLSIFLDDKHNIEGVGEISTFIIIFALESHAKKFN